MSVFAVIDDDVGRLLHTLIMSKSAVATSESTKGSRLFLAASGSKVDRQRTRCEMVGARQEEGNKSAEMS